MKLPKKLKVGKTGKPWMASFRFPFDRKLKDEIKQYPGVTWDFDNKVWLVPIELVNKLVELFEQEGFEVD